jgi:hypothetical protein
MTTDHTTPRSGLSRRQFLRIGGGGTLVAVAAGAGLAQVWPRGIPATQAAPGDPNVIRLIATDGFVSFPGRRSTDPGPLVNPDDGRIYVFGFRGTTEQETSGNKQQRSLDKLIQKYKGKVQWPSPILGIENNVDLFVVLSNLGFLWRPDLDDSHTIHWHGFRNPNAVFDGVPEVSVSVPLARDFPYYYKPRDTGTYMYHCHFEDVEHVQMGMDGIVYIKSVNGNYAYDLPNGSPAADTAFDREFALLLNEVDPHPHDNLINIQEFVWSDYKPSYWVINGRSYPDTVLRDQDPMPDIDFGFTQPVSSLIQLNAGETGLLRISSLGYEQHTMQLLGIPMRVVGHDSSYLGSNAYTTGSIYIGAGEARDVLITAPSFKGGDDTDGAGDYDRYWFRNRSAQRLVNGTETGLGGMLTEVRVYESGTLGTQSGPNVTF